MNKTVFFNNTNKSDVALQILKFKRRYKMRQLSTVEVLNFTKLMQMEVNALAIAKAGINLITDEQLKTLANSGVQASEARIMGLQQFISENNIDQEKGVQ